MMPSGQISQQLHSRQPSSNLRDDMTYIQHHLHPSKQTMPIYHPHTKFDETKIRSNTVFVAREAFETTYR